MRCRPPGTAVVLGGYSQDKAQIITADTACMVLGTDRTAKGPVLIHDCNGTRGTSGSPLLALQRRRLAGGGHRRRPARPTG